LVSSFSAYFCGSLSHIPIALLPFFPPIHPSFPLPSFLPPSFPPLRIDRIAIRQAHALAELTRVVVTELAIEGSDALHVLLGELKVKEGEVLLQGKEGGRKGGREKEVNENIHEEKEGGREGGQGRVKLP